MSRRTKTAQRVLNDEIDRRLMEFQSPKEIAAVLPGSMTNSFIRAKRLGLVLQRITDEERDHLLVRRTQAKAAIDQNVTKTYWDVKNIMTLGRKETP